MFLIVLISFRPLWPNDVIHLTDRVGYDRTDAKNVTIVHVNLKGGFLINAPISRKLFSQLGIG